MEHFGQSKNSAQIMAEIIKLGDEEKSQFLYGLQDQRLEVVAKQAELLNITLTKEENDCLKAGMISSDFIFDLFDFRTSGKQTAGLKYYFDTIGDDLGTIIKEYEINPYLIWTVTLEGNDECITNGFYRVNRFAYLIQKEAAQPCSLTFHDVWEIDDDEG